jgi:indole-3-glycerol phosphate synthase
MANILDEILEHKRSVEVPARVRAVPLSEMRRRAEQRRERPRDFAAALRRSHVALIAEVKRASPSRGIFIHEGWDPAAIARTYVENGAAAVSVLTDENYFRGHLDYLAQVRAAVAAPVLRKDFLVDDYQVYEAAAAAADAVLLIVAALDDAELRGLYDVTAGLGLTALVEVHDEAETERAVALGATVIGVNNRDLRTFRTDMQATARCARLLDFSQHTLVSESGIFTSEDVARVAAMGARAVLVGEAVILAEDRAAQVRALAGVPVQPIGTQPAP